MRKIAIYGEVIDQKHYDFIKGFFKLINELSFEYVVYSKYASLVKEKLAIDIGQAVFSKSEELVQNNTEWRQIAKCYHKITVLSCIKTDVSKSFKFFIVLYYQYCYR